MRRPFLLVLALCALLASGAAAGPDAPRGASSERARQSFEAFARDWMAAQRGIQDRQPRVAAGPGSLLFTYRSFAQGYRTLLEPTGQAGAPWIGYLHYTEQVFNCRSLESRQCTVAATVPVTEIFRLRGGRWSY